MSSRDPATRSSVSRDLEPHGLGAPLHLLLGREGGRVAVSQGAPLIRSVRTAGPCHILMLTMEGAGTAVAAAIDVSDWEDLVGTVAAYSMPAW